MKNPFRIILVSVAVVAGLVALLVTGGDRPSPVSRDADGGTEGAGSPPLLLYCAAGIKSPVELVAQDYEKEFGVRVELQYGGSGTLLSNLQVAATGDLYLAADSSYIRIAREKDLIDETIPLAVIRPVICVPKGNPDNIATFADLAREDLRISLANPEAASVGKVTMKMLESLGLWKEVEAAARARGVFKPTVNEVANDVHIGASDAGIVWDATVNQYEDLESVTPDGTDPFIGDITVAVLRSSENPTRALHFARYLGANDRGLKRFAETGFPKVEGDAWADVPEIVYYAGGVNRLAIQETLGDFERREGCRITTVYNGCGILLGQIKLGERPDGYHTCDVTFMDGVESLFGDAEAISSTRIVILAKKDNPLGIGSLADLTRPGLKVGVTNEEQSALGALTVRLTRELGLYDGIYANVAVRTPTADLLISQIRTGSLDAVIVYDANATLAREFTHLIEIDHPMARATQTIAVGANSRNKRLVGRLFETIHSSGSVERFRGSGFEWLARGDTETP